MQGSTIHLRTFAAGALFTLACWAGSSIASPTPATHGVGGGVTSAKPLAAASGPNALQKIAALSARLDRLQRREAQDRELLNGVALDAQGALDVTDCIVSALYITVDPDTGAFIETDPTEDGDYVPTLDPECLA